MQSQSVARSQRILIWRELTSVFKPWCVVTLMVTATLVFLIYIGVTLFLSHYYLDPHASSINAVDVYLPSYAIAVALYFVPYIFTRYCIQVGVRSKILYVCLNYCIIFIGFLISTIITTYLGTLSVGLDPLTLVFSVSMYSFTYILCLLNIIFKLAVIFKWLQRPPKIIISVILVVYFFLFCFILTTLLLPESNTPVDPRWEDTKIYSYISVVNLIFITLQVAVNTLAFLSFLSLMYTSNQLQGPSFSARGLDSDSMHSTSDNDLASLITSSNSQSEADIPIQVQASYSKDHILFLHYEQLECNHSGLDCVIEDHDVTLRIPEGAVAEGKTVHFEVGVAIYGSFFFPENTQPISPILWLNLLEEDIRLNEQFQLILPHCYSGSVTPPDQISFAIADLIFQELTDDQTCHSFELWERGTDVFYDEMYGAIQTDFCNHIFSVVKHTKYEPQYQDLSFSLTRVDLHPSQTVQEFHFYGLFNLATHRQALDANLQNKGQKISFSTPFQFNSEGSQPSIKLVPLTTDRISLLDPAHGELRASDINYWKSSFTDFRTRVVQGSYPPRIRMEVFHTGPGTFPIKFMGCTSDNSLEYQLLLPADHSSNQMATIPSLAYAEGQVVEELRSFTACEVGGDIDLPSIESFMPQATPRPPEITGEISEIRQGAHVDEVRGSRPDVQPVHQSTYFSTAEKTARVPFLDHQMLECDCNGREYTNVYHDITLRIPEGAVAQGEKVHFEVGVAMYGPFSFPENTQPISPILWLCLEEGAQLKKPFQVILPHYLTGLSKERIQYHQVGFAKANHSDLDNQMSYTFQHYDTKPLLASSGYRNYGVLISKHCCFYCLQAKLSPELAMDAGYCLVRIEYSLTPQRNEIHFSTVYFLDTCLRSLEEQFPCEEGYKISRCKEFKFKESDIAQPSIKLTVPTEHDQCIITLEPANAKIKVSEIEFWRKSFDDMRRRHERRMYPPRITMTISLNNSDTTVKLPLKFSGHVGEDDHELDVELTLPIGFPLSSPTSSLSTGSQNTEPQSQTIICGKPELRDAFRELFPLATYWKTIGTLLGLPGHILEKIKTDEDTAHDRLQKMLSEWLKQVDSPPTWKALADAVEIIDKFKAQDIRKHCVDV